jgi:ADP-heptose:LPS heptosyltransferase
MRIKYFFAVSLIIAVVSGCTEKRNYRFVKQQIPRGSSIAIIIDCKNDMKNAILSKFLEKGYRVKAINASDLYTLSDVFTVKDYKKLAYDESEIILGNNESSLNSVQKSYDNIYKLHVYSYETHKAEILTEMKTKWGIKYLFIIDLKNWESVSWARTIDLDTLELIGVENYPTKYNDRLDSIIDHFIESFGML